VVQRDPSFPGFAFRLLWHARQFRSVSEPGGRACARFDGRRTTPRVDAGKHGFSGVHADPFAFTVVTRMRGFHDELQRRLDLLRGQGLLRELRRVDSPQSPRIEINGRVLLNFSSNDYLGLANDPRLKEAAVRATEKFGVGAGAARLICGSLAPHHELEDALASFKGCEAALTFSSGYATALGIICALVEKDDVLVIDKGVHASIVDAARLSGAKLRVFAHNDVNDLEGILKWADRRNTQPSATRRPHILIVTESVFSMHGDQAPLARIVELKEKFGAWLMVDEAHATGLYGQRRRGLAEQFAVSDRIEVQMGTLGKALGAAGGYVCGSRVLIDYLINRARSFIFSTAPPPAVSAAAAAAIQVVRSHDGEARCQHLWERVGQIAGAREPLESPGVSPSPQPSPAGRGGITTENTKQPQASAIMPVVIGGEAKAVEIARALYDAGICVPSIRYPTVPRGQAQLRLTVTAGHTAGEVSQLLAVLDHNLKSEI
jgi:8-amino-7-oxononanoate synthase